MALHAGIDTGGTFTDLVVLDDETGRTRRRQGAVDARRTRRRRSSARSRRPASTPRSLASVTVGTTVGTNALLERKGARVLLLTTAGFEDVVAIGRIDKEDPYDLRRVKPEPFAARPDCLGVRERLAADGAVSTPLDEAELERVAALLIGIAFTTLALCAADRFRTPASPALRSRLVFCSRNPAHVQ